jgi:DNA-binding transcriptional LysR family regulator
MHRSFTMGRDQLNGVIAFLRVAELRSFRAAARELGLSPSGLSQTIRGLEARMGAALLTRTTRKVGLTEAGERFLEHARPAIERLLVGFEAAQALGADVTGLLRLNIPRPLLRLFAGHVLPDFCAAYPSVELELFAEDGLVNIIEEGFDAGVRLGELLEADMVAVRLTPPFRFVVVGAPSYFERYGHPARPEDLKDHRCIRSRRSSRRSIYRWEFVESGREIEVEVHGPLIHNDTQLNVAAAVTGLGLSYTPEPLAQAHLNRDELQTTLDAFCPNSPGMFLYYPDRAQALPKLRAFVDFARDRVRRGFEQLMQPHTP